MANTNAEPQTFTAYEDSNVKITKLAYGGWILTGTDQGVCPDRVEVFRSFPEALVSHARLLTRKLSALREDFVAAQNAKVEA